MRCEYSHLPHWYRRISLLSVERPDLVCRLSCLDTQSENKVAISLRPDVARHKRLDSLNRLNRTETTSGTSSTLVSLVTSS